jgi:uncharacterized membrane protein
VKRLLIFVAFVLVIYLYLLYFTKSKTQSIPVAVLTKAHVCARLIPGVAGSFPPGALAVCLL